MYTLPFYSLDAVSKFHLRITPWFASKQYLVSYPASSDNSVPIQGKGKCATWNGPCIELLLWAWVTEPV